MNLNETLLKETKQAFIRWGFSYLESRIQKILQFGIGNRS